MSRGHLRTTAHISRVVNVAFKNMKGQLYSLDMIFAIIIFSFTITILALSWLNINDQLSAAYTGSSGTLSLQASSMISGILSQGYPYNWYAIVNTTNTLSWQNTYPGIYNSQGVISNMKLAALESMVSYNYSAIKPLLGLGYEYYIEIYSPDNQSINLTIGRSPFIGDATTIYVDKEPSILDGKSVIVETLLWTNESVGVT